MKKAQQSTKSLQIPSQSLKQQVKKAKPNPINKNASKPGSKSTPHPIAITQKHNPNDVFTVSFDSDSSDDENKLVQLSACSSPQRPSSPTTPSETFTEFTDSREYREMTHQLNNMQRLHQFETNELEVSIAQKRKMPSKSPKSGTSSQPALEASYQDIPKGLLKEEQELTYAQLYGEEEDPHELPLPAVSANIFNPFAEVYKIWMSQAPHDMARIFDPSLSDSRRKQLIDHLPTISQRQYSWAIPTNEAVKLMYNFSPIIEIGAGKGYWGYLLRKYAHLQVELNHECKVENPDDVYAGFDCCPAPLAGESAAFLNHQHRLKLAEDKALGKNVDVVKKKSKLVKVQHDEPMKFITDKAFPSWTRINIGDSNELKQHEFKKHTLFLCYPDDYIFSEASLAYDCLKKFKGEYIITVGEWLGETRQENPWGRSADGEFQQHLCDQFHKLCHITLPSWHSSSDHFCVWKRTIKCAIDKSEQDDGVIFRYIPEEEKLQIRAFAPCLADLLEATKSEDDVLPNPTKFNKQDKQGKREGSDVADAVIGPKQPRAASKSTPQAEKFKADVKVTSSLKKQHIPAKKQIQSQKSQKSVQMDDDEEVPDLIPITTTKTVASTTTPAQQSTSLTKAAAGTKKVSSTAPIRKKLVKRSQ